MTKKKRRFFKESYVILTKSLGEQIPLLPLTILTFILIATMLFVPRPIPLPFPREQAPAVSLAPLPRSLGFPAPRLNAAAAIVLDPTSSAVLFEKNADVTLPPASTTKIMTALVVLENYRLSDEIQVAHLETRTEGQKMKLLPGELITVQSLLEGLLIFSANDAAEALSSNFPGGRNAFVGAMNKITERLSLSDTSFQNPSGLFEEGHFSTVRSLAQLAAYAMNNPTFSAIVATRGKTVTSIDGNITHKLTNLNILLWRMPGVLGVKTGKTDEGGEALVTYIKRDSHPLVIVVLSSTDRFRDTRVLIEWAYTNYQWAKPSQISTYSLP